MHAYYGHCSSITHVFKHVIVGTNKATKQPVRKTKTTKTVVILYILTPTPKQCLFSVVFSCVYCIEFTFYARGALECFYLTKLGIALRAT